MAGTIMATYKARLLTQLQANSTLSSLQVTYAEPGQSQRREAVFLGDIDNNTHIPESLSSGRRRRIEEFSCEVFVQVSSKPTPQTCEARAVELANAVETVVADDPQLNDLSKSMEIYRELYVNFYGNSYTIIYEKYITYTRKCI